jgi:hypothetical protein
MAEWIKLTQKAKPSLKGLLLAEEGRTEYLLAPRGKLSRRKTPEL